MGAPPLQVLAEFGYPPTYMCINILITPHMCSKALFELFQFLFLIISIWQMAKSECPFKKPRPPPVMFSERSTSMFGIFLF